MGCMTLLGVGASFMAGQILVFHQSINVWSGSAVESAPVSVSFWFIYKLKNLSFFLLYLVIRCILLPIYITSN
jgi:hypothetical protein